MKIGENNRRLWRFAIAINRKKLARIFSYCTWGVVMVLLVHCTRKTLHTRGQESKRVSEHREGQRTNNFLRPFATRASSGIPDDALVAKGLRKLFVLCPSRCSETRFDSWPLVCKVFRVQCTNSTMTTPQVQYEKILASFFRFIAIAKRHRRLLFSPIFILQN